MALAAGHAGVAVAGKILGGVVKYAVLDGGARHLTHRQLACRDHTKTTEAVGPLLLRLAGQGADHHASRWRQDSIVS